MTVEKLITDHIDIWSSALQTRSTAGRGSNGKIDLYGIKKLRELILELAVRGKLVPQDPNDEPASELLKRISAEKAELVKQGKIRKQKPLPEISEDEKPFELPEGWEWVRFGNIYEMEYGNNLPQEKRTNTGEYNVYGSNGVVGTHNVACVNSPCIVIGRKGSAGALNLSLNIGCWVTDVAYSSIPPMAMNLDFVFMQFHTLGLDSLGKGIKPGLNRNDAYGLTIAIPPQNEQENIVLKIKELMALCDQLEQQSLTRLDAHQQLVETLLATLTNSQNAKELSENWSRISQYFDILFTTEASIDALKQTILQLAVMGKLVPQDPNDEPASELARRIEQEKAQMVKDGKIKKQKPLPPISDEEKPFELPQGWEWCRIGEIIANMDAGWSPACLPESSPNENIWGVLKTTAVQNLEYREQENKTLPSSKQPRPQYEVQSGDILVTRAGPKNRVGISCLVENTRSKLMISDKIIRFHLVSNAISAKYISLCLNCGVTADYLEASKSGMAESQMNISQDNLKLAPVALPPTATQLKVISTIENFSKVCDTLKSGLQSAQQTQLHLADALTDAALN
ncbi:TPA: restriction endonuclease subunit S [Providencia stuartii]|uniref:Restriction endonuclease subunit S n=1 Tax=Providencia huashanensis TaxID=3037798 RepID=A0ABT9ARW2_9GAMM|nr:MULTISPECIES: restriction endonuclease subunit S [Providencia]AXO19643.1 restriction endonuclease subunit S [Providencia stuartii]MBN5591635.1 restriction endonuclease subunit S [Providencia stuartii]MDO7832360.1 restriction endonuclease subunit S [Providencia sp. CRE-138-0026]MDO7856805.1 restriction endonuclease subunit S [Providencia sp. CRE-138-0111]HEM6905237.1 restriction endonuclease subunit S [Providencia stuartii]